MKLVDIPVFFICPSHNEKYLTREKHMYDLLHRIGFKSITHFKSSTEDYPTCLVKATTDILNQYMNNEPVIIVLPLTVVLPDIFKDPLTCVLPFNAVVVIELLPITTVLLPNPIA